LEGIGVPVADPQVRGVVLRALDKRDRLGEDGVRALLGVGRKDESGDYTKGAGLSSTQIDYLLRFSDPTIDQTGLRKLGDEVIKDDLLKIAWNVVVLTLDEIGKLTAGYGDDQIVMDTSIIRGLDYYTGPVFEAQLTFKVKNDEGQDVVFGSVAGGGRYDDLVARFTGQQVPATGISIGVSRLLAAMQQRGLTGDEKPLIVVLSMGDAAASFATARELRAAGLRAESYVGTKKIPDQLKYADKRGAALVVMEGDDERAKGEVTIKDLKLGTELSKSVESRAEWVGARAAQTTVKRVSLVEEVRKMLKGS
jgi:histidyl-tRNA synthetase